MKVDIFEKYSGQLFRTYSKKVHGENYARMADQFVAKFPAYTIKRPGANVPAAKKGKPMVDEIAPPVAPEAAPATPAEEPKAEPSN